MIVRTWGKMATKCSRVLFSYWNKQTDLPLISHRGASHVTQIQQITLKWAVLFLSSEKQSLLEFDALKSQHATHF